MASKKPDIQEVAHLLGMKESEILEIVLDPTGVLAQTHDRNWTLIRNDGELEFRGKDPKGAEQE